MMNLAWLLVIATSIKELEDAEEAELARRETEHLGKKKETLTEAEQRLGFNMIPAYIDALELARPVIARVRELEDLWDVAKREFGADTMAHVQWVHDHVKVPCQTCKNNFRTTFDYDACMKCEEKTPFIKVAP